MLSNKIFIGDNLSVMTSSTFEKYRNGIDFIYIDPPYNTKHRFAYNDANDLWSRDISLRLGSAKSLLTDEGVIFISIDDNELANLLSIGYRIFGKENYVGIFITKQAQRSNAKHINIVHEYVVCFAKNKKKLPKFYIQRIEDPFESDKLLQIIEKVNKEFQSSRKNAEVILKNAIDKYVRDTGNTWIKNYSNIDEQGRIFFAKDLSTPGKPSRLIINEIGLILDPLKSRGWSSKEKILNLHKQNRLCYRNGRPYAIEYLEEATNNVPSILDFYSRFGTNDLKKLGLDGVFDTPKPVELIKFLIRCSQHKDSIILDFYAGSGTTAQAVYEINKEDNRHHEYVLIQREEFINPNTEAFIRMQALGYEQPTVDQAMLLRINTYLEQNNMNKDYTVEKIEK